MKPFTVWVSGVALATGGIAGTAAYQLTSGSVATDRGQVEESVVPSAPQTETPRTVVRLKACTPPAHLRHHVCVTDVDQVIAVPAPAQAQAPASTPGRHDSADDGPEGTSNDDGAGHESESEHGVEVEDESGQDAESEDETEVEHESEAPEPSEPIESQDD